MSHTAFFFMANTVTKEIQFDYGHRLGDDYAFKCRYIHGHRGRALITFSYETANNLDMGIDFSEIKRRVGGWIDDNWDHGFIVGPRDRSMIEYLRTNEQRYYVMTLGLPTAENIARELFYITSVLFEDEIRLVLNNVQFYETPSSYVDCSSLNGADVMMLGPNLRASLLSYRANLGTVDYHV